MSKFMSLLAGAAFFASVGLASAAEPVALNDTQMDQVAAGAFNFLSTNIAIVGQNAQSAAFAGNSFVNIGTVSVAGSQASNSAIVTQF